MGLNFKQIQHIIININSIIGLLIRIIWLDRGYSKICIYYDQQYKYMDNF